MSAKNERQEVAKKLLHIASRLAKQATPHSNKHKWHQCASHCQDLLSNVSDLSKTERATLDKCVKMCKSRTGK